MKTKEKLITFISEEHFQKAKDISQKCICITKLQEDDILRAGRKVIEQDDVYFLKNFNFPKGVNSRFLESLLLFFPKMENPYEIDRNYLEINLKKVEESKFFGSLGINQDYMHVKDSDFLLREKELFVFHNNEYVYYERTGEIHQTTFSHFFNNEENHVLRELYKMKCFLGNLKGFAGII